MANIGELSETKRRLLAMYMRGGRESSGPAIVIPRRPAGTPAPLSVAQERMWSFSRQHPEATCYNEPITLYRKGPLDVAVLERSLT
jgi:hypothetical protein